MCLFGVGAMFATSGLMAADGQTADPDLVAELIKLRSRIDGLERQLAVQKTEQAKLASQSSSLFGGKSPVLSSVNLEIYGRVYGQASYDSSETGSPFGPAYASRQAADTNKSYTEASARRTRLGLKIDGPEVSDGKVTGLIEGDFSNASNVFRFRHGYIKWTRDGWTLIAGQTGSLTGDICPDVMCDNGMANSGSMDASRAPQVRVEKAIEINKTDKVALKVAITNAKEKHTNIPHIQGSIAYTTPVFCEKDSYFGVSGLVGKDRKTAPVTDPKYSVWAVKGSVELPFSEYIALSGAIYCGQNLSSYDAGLENEIGANGENLKAHGGFAQIALTPTKSWLFNVGAGIAKVKDTYLAADKIKSNFTTYANARYYWSSNLWTGIELSHIATKYNKDSFNGNKDKTYKNNRVELGLCYSF